MSSLFSILSIFTDNLVDDLPMEKQSPAGPQESVFPGLKRDSTTPGLPENESMQDTPTPMNLYSDPNDSPRIRTATEIPVYPIEKGQKSSRASQESPEMGSQKSNGGIPIF